MVRHRATLTGPAALALLALTLVATQAADLPAAPGPPSIPLPSLALDPQHGAPSIWSGMTIGTQIFAVSGKGVRGGHVGGGGALGYAHEFADNVVVGLEGSVGYSPSLGGAGVHGFDYGAANLKVGYDLGRIMPYVNAGVLLAKPNVSAFGGYANPASSANALFNGGGVKALGTVGAGVDYAVTNNFHVGVNVSVTNNRNGFFPP